MHADFYATVASVMPILLLALLWDSGFLRRLSSEQRTLRRPGVHVPGGVLFWTKPRVRYYSLFVTAVVLCGIATAVLRLGEIVPDNDAVRHGEVAVLMLELVTIFTRITVDIVAATQDGVPAAAVPAPTVPAQVEEGLGGEAAPA